MCIVCVYGTESTTVHPSKLPETIENNETEIAPTKQRLMSIRGRGRQYMNTFSSHALSANWTHFFHHVPVPLRTSQTAGRAQYYKEERSQQSPRCQGSRANPHPNKHHPALRASRALCAAKSLWWHCHWATERKWWSCTCWKGDSDRWGGPRE